MYDNPGGNGPPAGSFYLSAVTVNTDPAGGTEMRNVWIEVAFAKNYTGNKHLNLRREAAMKAGLSAYDSDDLECAGAERYPIGGGILSQQLELAVTGGVGAYTGARGQVKINYDAGDGVFRYDFYLM